MSILLSLLFCPICLLAEPQTQDFVTIKNKSPQDIFDDANYLYQLGDFEGALALFNRAYDQADDPILKRKAKLGAEVTGLLLKSERVSPKEAQKVVKRAGKIKDRQKKEQLDNLYKDAFRYYFNENYEKAGEIFRKILDLYPDELMAKDYLQVKIPAILKEQKIKSLFAAGVSGFSQRDYTAAKEAFNQIISLDPKHKDTLEYLQVRIPKEEKDRKISLLYQQAILDFGNQNYDSAAGAFNEILSLDPNQKEAGDFVKVKIPAALLEGKIKPLYERALGAFSQQDYSQAIDAFKEILALDPGQKEAKDYLEQKIPAQLALGKKQKIDALYRQALSDFADKKYDSAAKAFDEILIIEPGEAQAQDYAKTKIPALLKAEKIASLYAQALADFKQADYEKALQGFNEILSLDPEQKEAKDYAQVKIPVILIEQKVKSLYIQATAYFQIKSYAKAEEFFKQILALDPTQEKAKAYLEKEIPQKLKEIEDAKRLLARREAEKFSLEMEKTKAREKREEEEKELASKRKSVQIAPKEKKVEKKKPAAPVVQKKEPLPKKKPAAPVVQKKEPLPEKKPEVLTREQASPRLGVPTSYPREGVVGYMYEMAFKYYKEGDLELAGEYFQKVILASPDEQLAKKYLREIFK